MTVTDLAICEANRRPGMPCRHVAVVWASSACIHEHIRSGLFCDRHRQELRAGILCCRPCREAGFQSRLYLDSRSQRDLPD